MGANRRLALIGRGVLNARLDLAPAAPEEMIGSLAGLVPVRCTDPWDLKLRVRNRHRVEFATTGWGDDTIVIRASAQRYNSIEDFERLAAALSEELS